MDIIILTFNIDIFLLLLLLFIIFFNKNYWLHNKSKSYLLLISGISPILFKHLGTMCYLPVIGFKDDPCFINAPYTNHTHVGIG